MTKENTMMTKIGDVAKYVGQGILIQLGFKAIDKGVLPRLKGTGKRILDKMAEIQGRKSATELEELNRKSRAADPEPLVVSPEVPETPTTSPTPNPDGSFEAKF